MKAKVRINGTVYELDVDAAVKAGVLRTPYTPVTTFSVGDVFTFPNKTSDDIVILQSIFNFNLAWGYYQTTDKVFVFGGNNGKPLSLWCGEPKTQQEVLDYIASHQGVLVGNLNRFTYV